MAGHASVAVASCRMSAAEQHEDTMALLQQPGRSSSSNRVSYAGEVRSSSSSKTDRRTASAALPTFALEVKDDL